MGHTIQELEEKAGESVLLSYGSEELDAGFLTSLVKKGFRYFYNVITAELIDDEDSHIIATKNKLTQEEANRLLLSFIPGFEEEEN